MNFEFATAGRILFGPGRVAELGGEVAALGTRPMVVSSGAEGPARRALDSLAAAGLTPVATLEVRAEPTVELARAGAALAREAGADVIVAIGGGSVIDAAKAVAALAANDGDPLDYLEVVGRGRSLARPSLPCIAVPTTAGTGAEVTRNAVLRSTEHGVKASLRSPTMLPRVALVDPELTFGLPPAITAASGLDALTQLIEPFLSTRASALTDGLCREGIPRSARSLRKAYEHGDDAAAREDLALASLFAGLALANAGLGAVHGFAAPIGGSFPRAPHGAVCGRLLPIVVEVNLEALRERRPDAPVLDRFDEVAGFLTGDGAAAAEAGVAWISALVADLAIPGLATYGIAQSDVGTLVDAARKASSMRANPIELTDAELWTILERAL